MRADEEAIRELTLPWVLRGLEELRGARRMLADRPDFEAWMVTFHIEQAVEKLLKAALVYEQVRPPRTHDLADIRRLIPAGWRVAEIESAWLSDFALAGRYPAGAWNEGIPEPTWDDALRALDLAETVAVALRLDLVARGFAKRDVDKGAESDGP